MIQFDIENFKEVDYDQLKEWFEKNVDNLPDTLDGGYKYYRDVRFSAELWTYQADQIKEKFKGIHSNSVIEKNAIVRSSTRNLAMLYYELQKLESWNVPLAKA